MTPNELLQVLDGPAPLAPVYYLYGPETYFMDRALARILEKAFPGRAGRDLNYQQLTGKEIRGEAVVREARTLPMFSALRVLVLRQVQLAPAAEHEILTDYVKAPSPSTCLVLLAESRVDGRGRFGRALSSTAVAADCRHPYERELGPLLEGMAREHEVRLDIDAQRYLTEVVGSDLQALDDAVERLRLYAGRGSVVELDTVERCIAATRVHQIWDLTNAIGERRLDEALKVLGSLRADGLEALRAIPMLARTIRQLWTAKALGQERLRPDAIAKALGLPPFIARNVAQQARRFRTPDLIRAIEALQEAEMTLKSSELPASVRDWVVLEELVWTLTRGAA